MLAMFCREHGRFGKLIADARGREDILRVRGIRLDFAAQAADVDPEKLGFLTIASAPNSL